MLMDITILSRYVHGCYLFKLVDMLMDIFELVIMSGYVNGCYTELISCFVNVV